MSNVSLSLILSVADAFGIELLVAFRHVCKAFHSRWIKHIRQLLLGKDNGCIVTVEDSNLLNTLFIDVQIIDIDRAVCTNHYQIYHHKKTDITRFTHYSTESMIWTHIFGDKQVRYSRNAILALIKHGSDVCYLIQYCIDSLFDFQ